MPDDVKVRPIDGEPKEHREVAGFGDGDSAASIKYSVPLPGAVSFDRITPLDIDQGWFTQKAKEAGLALADLNVATVDSGRVRSLDAERLSAYFQAVLPPSARPSLRLAAAEGAEVHTSTGKGKAVQDAAKTETDARSQPTYSINAEPLEVAHMRRQRFFDNFASIQAQEIKANPVDVIKLPAPGVGNSIRIIPMKVAELLPRIAIVETYQVSTSLGDYGLGRTLQTFTLLPGERTTITMETWRSTESSREDASSIFDSSDTAAQTRFTSALTNESGAAFHEQGGWAFSVGAKVEAGVNLGIVSASVGVETGYSADHQESRERFSKNVAQSASEHAAQVNTARQQSVQATAGLTSKSGSSGSTVRELANTNMRRVLNFVFRELNQEYRVVVSLRGVKIAFYNGNADSADVTPLAELPRLLKDYIEEGRRSQIAKSILSAIIECRDVNSTAQNILQIGVRNGGTFNWEDATLNNDGDLEINEDPLLSKFCWRMKLGPIGQEGLQEKERVPGVVTESTTVVLRTDNVVAEALLGRADALDPYASMLQALDLQSREVDIAGRQIEVERLRSALDLIKAQADNEKVAAWDKILGDKPDIEVLPTVAAIDRDRNG
jgi:hypothetical protein